MNEKVYIVTGPRTGKTTYLNNQLARAREKFGAAHVRACSYTKAAAIELASRVDLPKKNVGTLHSFCFHALDRPELVKKHLAEWNKENVEFRFSNVKDDRDVDDPLDDPLDDAPPSEKTLGDKLRAETEILRAGMVPVEKWNRLQAEFHREWSRWKENNDLMDFTDMLEIAYRDFSAMPGNPAVIALDEGQDSSKLQLSLVMKWSKEAMTTIICHDTCQTIYEWCGADPSAIIDLQESLPTECRKFLRQSSRIPASVHRVAEAWISQLTSMLPREFAPRAEEGLVANLEANYYKAEYLLPVIEREAGNGKSVMILGACKYHVGPIMAVLRKHGIPFHNPYRTKDASYNPIRFGDGKVTTMVDRTLAFLGTKQGSWTGHQYWQWASTLQAKGLLRPGAKDWLSEQKGNGDTVPFFDFLAQTEDGADLSGLEHLGIGGDTRRALKWWLEKSVPGERKKMEYPCRVVERHGANGLTDKPSIIVGNGHSVKGGEADTVIIFPDVSLAGMKEWHRSKESKDSIRRLFYVMMTRAREKLYVCRPAKNNHVEIPISMARALADCTFEVPNNAADGT